jgi:hypothetical protein
MTFPATFDYDEFSANSLPPPFLLHCTIDVALQQIWRYKRSRNQF